MDTYSVKEIAEMLNTNPETVRRWIRSGKLEAIQESRKSGNVVTKQMLDAFLKTSPKYAGIVAGLLVTPIGLTTATAAIVGGLFAKQIKKNGELKNAQVNVSEITKLLQANINDSLDTIRRKQESIGHLKTEIESEQQRINEFKQMLKEIEELREEDSNEHNR